MTDILLIQPPIRDFYLTRKRTIPYGLASIAATLKKEGFRVVLFDALATSKRKNIDWPHEMEYLAPYYLNDQSAFALFQSYKHFGYSYEHIAKVIRQTQPTLAGISSLFTAYSAESLKVAEVIKENCNTTFTVVGGHHPTTLPEAVIEHPCVDFVIRGEGEAALPRLARALIDGRQEGLETIPGIVFRTPDGHLVKNDPAVIADINACPAPSLDLIKTAYYQRRKKGAAVIVTSRGCPYKCSYCCVGSSGGIFRQRSVASVLDEITTAVEQFNVGFIDFEDEHLTLNKKWFMNLLAGLQDRLKDRPVELRAMNGLFPPSLDREMLAAMQQAGFQTLNLSIGTISRNLLQRFQRQDVKAAVDRILIDTQSLKLKSVCYIIAAAPLQTAWQTLADMFYLAAKPSLIGVSIFYPAPGSQDYQLCREMGILPSSYTLMRSSAMPLNNTTSRLEGLTLLRLARILNYMKSRIDSRQMIPAPAPYNSSALKRLATPADKMSHLLAAFLHDHKIRGIDQDGQGFEHQVAEPLCRRFAEEIDIASLKGTGASN